MSDRIIRSTDRPTTKIHLPATGIDVECYGSLMIRDAESMKVDDLLKGHIHRAKALFVSMIKSWNWYENNEATEPIPINEETIGWIHAEDIPVIMEGIENFQKEQKKN